jgi:hypothetical protein
MSINFLLTVTYYMINSLATSAQCVHNIIKVFY